LVSFFNLLTSSTSITLRSSNTIYTGWTSYASNSLGAIDTINTI
jgi:hypothetical protein